MSTRTLPATRPPFLELALELAELEADPEAWEARRARIRELGHPSNDGDDAAASGDDATGDTGDDATDATGDDAAATGDDDAGDDGADDDDAVKRALAAANRRNRELEREKRERDDKAEKAEGKWKERAERLERELEDLREEQATASKRTLASAALKGLNPVTKNVDRLVSMLDLDAIEDEQTAERAAKRLKREEPDLFRATTRQVKGAGRNGTDTNDDDKGNGNRQPEGVGVDRIRAAMRETAKT